MAIIFEDKYQRITDVDISADNDTKVKFCWYSSKQDRDNEKKNKTLADSVKKAISNYVEEKANLLMNEINIIQPINTIMNRETFLAEHSDIKEKIETFESMRDEAVYLQDKLLYDNIDLNNLKFRDVWTTLGLNSELCNCVKIVGGCTRTLKDLKSTDLSVLYTEVKKNMKGTVLDC